MLVVGVQEVKGAHGKRGVIPVRVRHSRRAGTLTLHANPALSPAEGEDVLFTCCLTQHSDRK